MFFSSRKTTILVAFLASAVSTVNALSPEWGECISNVSSCPAGFYCQPWSNTYYQCIRTNPKCPEQLTNVDFPGNDLKMVPVNHPDQCCDACANTPGCTHYTYHNARDGTPGCYLKSVLCLIKANCCLRLEHDNKAGFVSGFRPREFQMWYPKPHDQAHCAFIVTAGKNSSMIIP